MTRYLTLSLAFPPLCALLLYAGRARFYTHEQILDAIHVVESSGRISRVPAGDRGRSIGPLQISRAYWQDSRVAGHYEECMDLDYARTVVCAYMRRWVPVAWAHHDAEVIARVHNGGPWGMRKRATYRYWRRVKKVLELERH